MSAVVGLLIAGAAGAQDDPAAADPPAPVPATEAPETAPVFVPESGTEPEVEETATAAPRSSETTGRDGEPSWFRRPAGIMVRSVVVPGWGQLSNGRHWKAAVVAGVEGFLIFRAVEAGLNEQDANDRAEGATTEAAQAIFEADAQRFNERRRDYTWWTVFAVILSMGDAYVDAHLGNFEVEFEPLEYTDGYRAGLRWNIGR